jgi:hypothetical protein
MLRTVTGNPRRSSRLRSDRCRGSAVSRWRHVSNAGRARFAPLAWSVKIFSQPSRLRAASGQAGFWSVVETRAYPIFMSTLSV